ncbi:PASTA domain-containing protein [Polaribacter sp.]|uniref:PASTA domain-containing protein n=1 Tax=Polaribacter sp. TaxID=1920175 RepID=UPI0026002919|nr:PASTA domain-containing protein [Polaribacter sp.]
MQIFQFIKSKLFFKQLVIALVGFIAVFLSLKFWLTTTTNHNQKIQVPNLEKMTIVEAEKKIKEINLDYKVIDSASYNPLYPKKSVIEQTPIGGDFVKENRKIYLTLNPSKYRDISIPDLNGRTKRQAISELRAIGFIVGTSYTYVKDIGKDVVRGLRHNDKIVNPNDKLPKNSIIELVLGDGNR